MGFFTYGEIRTACGGTFNRDTDLNCCVENVVTDTRIRTEKALFIALKGENFDAHDFLDKALQNGAELLLIDEKQKDKLPPGATALLVKDTLKAYQDLAGFHRKRFPDLKLVAVTGSYGKTSTKEMLRSIFEKAAGPEHVLATEANYNNQIGVPKLLLELTKEHQYAVVEMGTDHFGEISPMAHCAFPDASLIVSIGNSHLEAFKSLDGVAQEKSNVYAPSSVRYAVYPAGIPQRDILEKASIHVPGRATFGKDASATVYAVYHGSDIDSGNFDLIHTPTGEKVSVQWPLAGEHQAVNCAGAAAVALAMGVDLQTIADGVRSVALPGQRMRRTKHGNTLWINDSYNANPDTMCASFRWLLEFADPARLVLALGDMGELGQGSEEGHIRVLSAAAENFPGSRITAVGPKMAQAADVLEKEYGKIRFTRAGSSAEAVEVVRNLVQDGDTVFLKGSKVTRMWIIEPQE